MSLFLSPAFDCGFCLAYALKAQTAGENCKGSLIFFENWETYSARKASAGEMRLALSAGINEATNADNPNAATAVSITKG